MSQSDPGTIIGTDGRVIVFSVDRFIRDICVGDCCFICGAAAGSKPFNNEHVVPQWVLRRYKLHNDQIILPNGKTVAYGTYKMPCCVECNSLLSARIEGPTSQMLDGDYDGILSGMSQMSFDALFIWLCLVFVKMHLKDTHHRFNPDRSTPDVRIADGYDWATLHHLHCLARLPYVIATVSPSVYGTLRTFRVADSPLAKPYDWKNFRDGQTIVARLGNIGIVCVLNDGGMVGELRSQMLDVLRGQTLTMIQLRELGAVLAMTNMNIVNRPSYHTLFDRRSGRVFIGSEEARRVPPLPWDSSAYGELLMETLDGWIPDSLRASLREGKTTFLFNSDGSFHSYPIGADGLRD